MLVEIRPNLILTERDINNFWSHVIKRGEDECWIWDAWTDKDGYGSFSAYNRRAPAHRIAWILINGAIPNGLYLLHSCDNPPCVNTKHLYLGDQTQNIVEASSKGRIPGNRLRGYLSPEQVREIRRRVANGEKQADMAREFGMTSSSISTLIAGKIYKHVQ